MIVRALPPVDIPAALDLAWAVFLLYEAPDYAAEGVDEFSRFLADQQATAALHFYGAYEADTLVGMLARRSSHISLLFVRTAYQRRGIGRALFNAARRDMADSPVTVHAAPFAARFYCRLGFFPTGPECTENGIRYIPMRLL